MTYDAGHLPRTINSTWMTDLREDKRKFKPSKFSNIKKKKSSHAHFKSYKNAFCVSLLWFATTLTILSLCVSN